MNTQLQLQLIDMLHSAPIARLFGMRLSYDACGHAHLHLPYNPKLDHALNGIHGGGYCDPSRQRRVVHFGRSARRPLGQHIGVEHASVGAST